MQKISRGVVVLGTGGTIAGTAQDVGDNIGYLAAQLGASALVAQVPQLAGRVIDVEQVAQVDSKDMDFAIWRQLAERVERHLGRPEVAGIVITHGTDTLEETAYFLQRLLSPAKPVVLTAAMRPATSLLADGPQNLLDSVQVASLESAAGVVAVLAGQVHSALDLRKTHPYLLDAFGSGDTGPVAHVEEGSVHQHRPWPAGPAFGTARLPRDASPWPWIEIVTSHAGARPDTVRMLCAAGVDGIVVAGTGNGSLHHLLEPALRDAQASGVAILRCTRCLNGRVIDPPGGSPLPSAGGLTAAQARIELMLQILDRR